MLEHKSDARTANLVATFDTQDEADEALLELRLAGFPDREIGYFARTPTGEMTDLLERNFWIGGATIGAILGIALGIWLARIIPSLESTYVRRLDSFGLMVTCATFGALFASTIGGLIGAGMRRRWLGTPNLGPAAYPFILEVRADSKQSLAMEALNRRGAHEIWSAEKLAESYPVSALNPT
jgi:hypothetical protein